MDSLIPVLVVAALVLANGLFVAAEFAIVGAPRHAIEARASRGDRLARRVRDILRDPKRQDRFIATAQLGITVASLGLGMYGEQVLAESIAARLESTGLTRWIAAHALASTIAVAILTYFHIVIGEMVPKSVALQHAEQTAIWITPPILWTKAILYPFVIGLNGLGNLVLKAIGIRRQFASPEQFYTPEELQLIVEESEKGGALRSEAGRMLRELFEFGDLTAAQVMVPRVDIAGIMIGATPQDVKQTLRSAAHTRYPIYDGDFDHIVGMAHIKDLLRAVLAGEPIQRIHARPLPVVPETAPVDHVLATMQRERMQMAIVIDEHGGTAGVVTLTDLFEEVVGEIEEGPTRSPTTYADAAGRLRVAGTLRLDELGQRFDLDLAHEDVDSVSGLVLMLLGRPPRLGDVVEYGRLRLEVTAVRGRGVREAAVSLQPIT